MGYSCPVCEIPHQDAIHLANHLAFTAMTHAGDHETWLDDTVPGWRDGGETDLASEVAEIAPEAAYDRVFEDTVDRVRRHNHGTAPDGRPVDVGPVTGGEGLDEDAQAILEEARGLTEAMLDGEGTPADDESTDDIAGE